MVTVTWVGGFGALVPTWLGKWGQFGLDVTVGSCSILPDSVGRSPKEILFIGAFVVPCLSIVVCYARIFYIVRKTALKSRTTAPSNSNSRNAISTKPSDATAYYTLKTRFKVPEISTDSAIGSSSATGTCSTTDTKEPNFLSPHDIIPDPSSSGLDDNGYSPISFSDRRRSRRRDRSPSSALNATITQVVSAVSPRGLSLLPTVSRVIDNITLSAVCWHTNVYSCSKIKLPGGPGVQWFFWHFRHSVIIRFCWKW